MSTSSPTSTQSPPIDIEVESKAVKNLEVKVIYGKYPIIEKNINFKDPKSIYYIESVDKDDFIKFHNKFQIHENVGIEGNGSLRVESEAANQKIRNPNTENIYAEGESFLILEPEEANQSFKNLNTENIDLKGEWPLKTEVEHVADSVDNVNAYIENTSIRTKKSTLDEKAINQNEDIENVERSRGKIVTIFHNILDEDGEETPEYQQIPFTEENLRKYTGTPDPYFDRLRTDSDRGAQLSFYSDNITRIKTTSLKDIQWILFTRQGLRGDSWNVWSSNQDTDIRVYLPDPDLNQQTRRWNHIFAKLWIIISFPHVNASKPFDFGIGRADQVLDCLGDLDKIMRAQIGNSEDTFTKDPSGNYFLLLLLDSFMKASKGEYETALEYLATAESKGIMKLDISIKRFFWFIKSIILAATNKLKYAKSTCMEIFKGDLSTEKAALVENYYFVMFRIFYLMNWEELWRMVDKKAFQMMTTNPPQLLSCVVSSFQFRERKSGLLIPGEKM